MVANIRRDHKQKWRRFSLQHGEQVGRRNERLSVADRYFFSSPYFTSVGRKKSCVPFCDRQRTRRY